ncbi:hypothetical protein FIBSPDRAFT_901490 [Athelia psychrophila]|uniref:Uncharacterized protein n=1 Tax=Athelia psychrophila TaxID=1759441 RepID=A0A165X3Y1_9AGAM|nr:hypothetical protein FIBSPDRAFT_901490 [Fibularhizoctonia sp. CBS 109695]
MNKEPMKINERQPNPNPQNLNPGPGPTPPAAKKTSSPPASSPAAPPTSATGIKVQRKTKNQPRQTQPKEPKTENPPPPPEPKKPPRKTKAKKPNAKGQKKKQWGRSSPTTSPSMCTTIHEEKQNNQKDDILQIQCNIAHKMCNNKIDSSVPMQIATLDKHQEHNFRRKG